MTSRIAFTALAFALATVPVRSAPSQALQSFTFETVWLDDQGKVTERLDGEAQRFVETLADGTRIELVAVPGESFQMGTPKGELEYLHTQYRRAGLSTHHAAESVAAETPAHAVRVAPFLIGRYEVTQAQWRAVARLPRVARELDPDPADNEGDDFPVEDISWDEAVEFCARLSKATGRTYRLPTEAEWEYACRAGSTTPFAFGPTVTPDFVNYAGDRPYGGARYGEERDETIPVGSIGVANEFGLSDMHGNVAEWCLDVWHPTYSGAPSDGSAWTAGGDAKRRVVRGGSRYSSAADCRSAARLGEERDETDDDIGFRIVLVQNPRAE